MRLQPGWRGRPLPIPQTLKLLAALLQQDPSREVAVLSLFPPRPQRGDLTKAGEGPGTGGQGQTDTRGEPAQPAPWLHWPQGSVRFGTAGGAGTSKPRGFWPSPHPFKPRRWERVARLPPRPKVCGLTTRPSPGDGDLGTIAFGAGWLFPSGLPRAAQGAQQDRPTSTLQMTAAPPGRDNRKHLRASPAGRSPGPECPPRPWPSHSRE